MFAVHSNFFVDTSFVAFLLFKVIASHGLQILKFITLRITGRQKQSVALVALIAVRVNVIVMFISGLAFLLTLTPQVNRQYREMGKPLQSTVPPP